MFSHPALDMLKQLQASAVDIVGCIQLSPSDFQAFGQALPLVVSPGASVASLDNIEIKKNILLPPGYGVVDFVDRTFAIWHLESGDIYGRQPR